MINRKEISKEQTFYAIDNGEFQEEVVRSKSVVVIVMTQDWCPQWVHMKDWLYGMETDKDIDIYELVYNKTSFSSEFRNFKEAKFKNYEIPYLRYYVDGKLVHQSNYVSQKELRLILGL